MVFKMRKMEKELTKVKSNLEIQQVAQADNHNGKPLSLLIESH